MIVVVVVVISVCRREKMRREKREKKGRKEEKKGDGARNEGWTKGPGAAGAGGGGEHSDQVCSSSPGIETSPHAVSVLARPSAESARSPTLETALIGGRAG